ncbi:MAG TPA: hypothetical protein VFE25_01160 [Opitutaceae bacterium]|jgi:hypothetical protein|nr:hypothetical protein [Opitutaceae bacterium]
MKKTDVPMYRPNLGKLIIAVAGTAFFGVGGAVILYHARQAAANGLPMVNEKGEVISGTKVYLGAAAMLAAAVLYGWRAKVVYRQRQLTRR